MMRLFVWLVALVLLLTGLAKVGTALAGGSAYGQADVVFSFLSLRQLLLLAGLLELGCVAWLLRPGQPTGKALLILWLSSLFWVYRLGLKLAEVQGPCPCLGAVPLWTPAWAVAVDGVLLGMLVFMTVGALGSLMAAAARLWRGSDAVRSPLPAATSANGRTDARFGRRAILGWGLVVWMPSLTLAPCGSVLGQSPEAAQALATVKRFITTPPTVADMIYRVRWVNERSQETE